MTPKFDDKRHEVFDLQYTDSRAVNDYRHTVWKCELVLERFSNPHTYIYIIRVSFPCCGVSERDFILLLERRDRRITDGCIPNIDVWLRPYAAMRAMRPRVKSRSDRCSTVEVLTGEVSPMWNKHTEVQRLFSSVCGYLDVNGCIPDFTSQRFMSVLTPPTIYPRDHFLVTRQVSVTII
jgi:hypothetical protein